MGLIRLLLLTSASILPAAERFDVIVYGGTSGGVAAAVHAARMGKHVALIHPGKHIGGLSSSGLGSTDTGVRKSIGGIAREFYRRVKEYYHSDRAWRQETRDEYLCSPERRAWRRDWDELMREPEWYYFEPHVAERIFDRMVAEAGVKTHRGERLDLRNGVKKSGPWITSIRMESGRVFEGTVFIDTSYEGDLMAKAGVSYTVGREADSDYGELFAGYRPMFARGGHQFRFNLSPYVVPEDASSGLLPGIEPYRIRKEGEGDRRIQAYNFRLVLTDVPSNRVPFTKPEGYDPRRYELFLRYLQAGVKAGQPVSVLGKIRHLMPNRKTDSNNHGAFSTDYVGANYDYPEGDYATRERIFREHVTYTKGLLWFVLSDPRVPAHAKEEIADLGWARDEFTDHDNFPRELYVREARRMIGSYVMTEHDCVGARRAQDSIGLGSYTIDSHVTHRYVDKHGHVRNEGTLGGSVPRPYPISYRAIVPRRQECTNLLVPVCLSATHVAASAGKSMGNCMATGHAAGLAAALAVRKGFPPRALDVRALQDALRQDGVDLERGA